jgi:hypothetical protein
MPYSKSFIAECFAGPVSHHSHHHRLILDELVYVRVYEVVTRCAKLHVFLGRINLKSTVSHFEAPVQIRLNCLLPVTEVWLLVLPID